jgi:hypothetical protein
MAWHRPVDKQQPHRGKDELWWDRLDTNANVIMQGRSRIRGWLLILDGKYIARSENGSVRSEFDTFEEARDFLWAIVNMEHPA